LQLVTGEVQYITLFHNGFHNQVLAMNDPIFYISVGFFLCLFLCLCLFLSSLLILSLDMFLFLFMVAPILVLLDLPVLLDMFLFVLVYFTLVVEDITLYYTCFHHQVLAMNDPRFCIFAGFDPKNKCSHAAKESANYGSIFLPSFMSLGN
jgi:hypothetical protein